MTVKKVLQLDELSLRFDDMCTDTVNQSEWIVCSCERDVTVSDEHTLNNKYALLIQNQNIRKSFSFTTSNFDLSITT